MVIADFSGSYTNELNCKPDAKGVVLTEGVLEEKESLKGDKYMQLSIDIEVNKKKLIHSVRMDEGRKLQATWGQDTKSWIGKEFKVKIVNYKSFGQDKQAVELVPL